MDAHLRAELADDADRRARLDPAQLDAAVRSGTRRLAARLLLVQAVAVVVTALLIGGFGLYAIAGADSPSLTRIDVAPASTTVAVGESASLVATGRYADGSTDDLTDSVEWSSEDTGVADVDDDGVVTAVGPGTIAVTAGEDGVTGTARITVEPVSAELTSLAITPEKETLAPDETLELTATGTYDDGTSVDLTDAASWTTSDADVAACDAGLVTASAPGAATITATVEGTSATARITVEPEAAELTSLEIAPDEQSLAPGKTVELTATGTYADGSSRDLTDAVAWTTSNPTVAGVSDTGVVTADGPGAATITATEAGLSDTARLTVEPVAPELTSLSVDPGKLSLDPGESAGLTAIGSYSDGSTEDLTIAVAWTTDDERVATVTGDGVVTAVGPGRTTLRAALDGVGDTAVVGVIRPVTVKGVELSESQAVQLCPGQTVQLRAVATYSDGGRRDVTGSAEWSTDDPAVATVSAGLVTFTGPFGASTDISVEIGSSSDSVLVRCRVVD